MGERCGQIVGASPTTEPPESGTHLMAALCAAAECRVTAKKKKESTAVKLKAVPTNVGVPKKFNFVTKQHDIAKT